jgi:hypothetical protein
MKNLISRMLGAARHFTGFDFAVFKICLLCTGLLLGSYFAPFFHAWIIPVWILAAISAVSLWIIILRNMRGPKH